MTQQQEAQLDSTVSKYKNLRDNIKKQIDAVRAQEAAGNIMFWNADTEVLRLERSLDESQERKDFFKSLKQSETDSVFEKYFRAICSKHFNGVPLDPNKL